MSQAKQNRDHIKINNSNGPYFKPKFKNSGNMRYRNRTHKDFQHYSAKYNFKPRWGFRRKRTYKNVPEKRSPSPFSGTEEYTLRKIQKTSDMIMKRLMMPPETDNFIGNPETPSVNETAQESDINYENDKIEHVKNSTKTKKSIQFNVEEIHNKIIKHITKLSHGKKVNLISANCSGYDVAIQQIQKQKRLELSKALRDMCSNQNVECSDVLNAIIPDIGIKLEDLPLEVIQQLSNTLNFNFEIEENINENDDDVVYIEPENMKQEVIEICEDEENTTSDENSCATIQLFNSVNLDSREIKVEKHKTIKSETNVDNVINKLSFSSEPSTSSNKAPSSVTLTQDSDITSINFNNENKINYNRKTTGTQTSTLALKSSNVQNINDAVGVMLEIDEEILHLTQLRQSIFIKLQNQQAIFTDLNNQQDKSPTTNLLTQNLTTVSMNMPNLDTANYPFEDQFLNESRGFYDTPLNFKPNVFDKILVIKLIDFEDTLLAASESGKLYYVNTTTGRIKRHVNISAAPITCLCYWITNSKKLAHLLVGSIDCQMREYCYGRKEQLRITNTKEAVQCMEQAWDFAFVGTTNGTLLRYSLKNSRIEFEDKISKDSVLVLKATQEGARRVLLVGTRNAPVCVRDAMSGLHLRTMNDFITPTVYSLVLEKSMVYCGTTNHDILVFTFHDGNLIHKHSAANSKGISCLKVVKNLLFASCYNGNIYVYHTRTHEYIGLIKGPGGVIVSMEILDNLVIIGTLSCNFQSILIPYNILKHND